MLIHATTAAWGTWHVDQLLGVSLPSLLAPGNLPALAKAHRAQFNLVTTREDQRRIEATPVFQQLRELLEVKVRMLPDGRVGVPIAMQHRIWSAAQQRARRAGALALFLPPDVIWADGSLASLSRRIDDGKRALFNTYLRVASDSITSDLDREFRRDGTSLAVPPRALVAAGFRHLHPLMSCYLADSNHFPHHPEMIAFGVRGEGLLVRLLTRELFCFEPARFALTDQALLREVPDPDELHVFDDSDELCALSLTPLFKDHDWYTAQNVIDPAEVGLWWLQYDSPSNRFLWQRPIRYHTGEVTEEKWAAIERESEPLFHEFERVRELLRLHQALRTVGLDAFARVLGEATLRGELARHWDPREPATLLVPTDRAVAPFAHELGNASPERLTRFLVAHCKTGHLDLPAPWRPRTRAPRMSEHSEPPRVGGASLAGYGFGLGELEVYPIDRPLASV
jgi:hypothetical protein